MTLQDEHIGAACAAAATAAASQVQARPLHRAAATATHVVLLRLLLHEHLMPATVPARRLLVVVDFELQKLDHVLHEVDLAQATRVRVLQAALLLAQLLSGALAVRYLALRGGVRNANVRILSCFDGLRVPGECAIDEDAGGGG